MKAIPFLSACAGLLLGTAALAQAPAPAPAPAAATIPGPPPEIAAELRRIGPVIDVPGTVRLYKPLLEKLPKDGVTRTDDQTYGSDERNKLDVFAPEKREGAAPVIIFVHGGGFVRGDRKERDNVGYFFARNGVVTMVPSYRLGPKDKWPAGAEDIIAAAEWARANAMKFGGDPARIYLVGESAGAAHIAMGAFSKKLHPKDGLKVAGLVLISGAYQPQIELMSRKQFGIATPDPRNEAYFGTDFSRYPEMSIAQTADAPKIPTLMTYAELDPVQMHVAAGAMYTKLCLAQGACPDIKVMRGHSHISQVYTFGTGDTSLSDPILAMVKAK